jgi:signal transduction histidine kinase
MFADSDPPSRADSGLLGIPILPGCPHRIWEHYEPGRYGMGGCRVPGTSAGRCASAAPGTADGPLNRVAASAFPIAVYATGSWLAEARVVITAIVVCAAAVLIVTTVATRRRLIRAGKIRSVLSPGGPLTGSVLRDKLRLLIGDPGLEIYYRLPKGTELVTFTGEPAPRPSPAGSPAARQFVGAGAVDEGGYTALVDVAVSPDRPSRALRRVVLEAATPALENARLQATLRHQVLELARSRTQTVRAFLAERRRLEGQLHDGTQACLYEARSQVRRARPQVTDPAAAAAVQAAGETLGSAITELSKLVRGIYPAGLRETGLGSALFTATSDFPIPVEVADEGDADLDEVTATAGFFTVMDVLYIAARSGARSAAVRVSAGSSPGARLQLRISYHRAEPPGDADETGAWLAAEDRVRAMGGTMLLTSEDAAMTAEVEMPCES